MNDTRLMELEIKIAFHEDTIKVLNDVVYQQQKNIDRLELLVRQCREDIDRNSSGSLNQSTIDEKPPHY
jgi:SlyX protein